MRAATALTSLTLILALTSCGSNEAETTMDVPDSSTTSATSPAESSTPSTTSTTTTSPSSSPTSASRSDENESATVSSDDDEPSDASMDDSSDSSSEETPEVLTTDSSGQVLGLAQVFSVIGDWDSERFSGAGQSDVRGTGLDLLGCYASFDEAQSSSYGGGTGQLELRLDRKFERVTFNAFQTNASTSSDETLVVEVLAGGEQVDIRRIAFDKLQDFDLPIAGKNAVKIRVFLETRTNCDRRTSASVAITNLTVI